MTIRRYLIPISGFMQSQAKPTGLERLWRRLVALDLPRTHVFDPIPWKYDMDSLAAFLHRQQAEDGPIDVRVFPYSWGAGHGLPELGRALDARGIPITAVVACDPIYRSQWLAFRWLAVSEWFKRPVMLPPNVEWAWWFYQTKSRPGSGGLVASPGSGTLVGCGRELHSEHIHADDNFVWHDLCLRVAGYSLDELASKAAA